MRSTILIPLAAALGLVASAPTLVPEAQAEAKANRPDVLSIQHVKKGMKGYGLTVFEGTEPEKFDVEVIDVLHNFRPRQELILVKTTHPRLEVAKIVGGMSGSPIYLQGKMVGAYAYGWTFGVEPVAGVTPIRSMLDDLERPLPKMLHGYPLQILPEKSGKKIASLGRFRGSVDEYSLTAHAEQLAKQRGVQSAGHPQLTPVSTPLLMGGMTADAVELARQYLEPLGLVPLQAGGSGGKPSGKSQSRGFVDGGALGVDLVSGDVSAMGLGTVTRVEQNKLVAFGHPMMNVGVTSLPTTRARVLWFMASQMRSFKVGEATDALGALVNDRQASIVVDENIVAPTTDVSLEIEGEPGAPFTKWNFRVAHDQFLTPSLLGVALGNGITATAAERRHVTWFLRSTIEFDGFPPIVVDDFGASPAGTPNSSQIMQSSALEAVGQVLNNRWQPARLTKVAMKLSLTFEREVAELRDVELLTPEVDPGEKVRVRLTFEPYDGKTFSRVMTIVAPESKAGETLALSIRPGYSVEPVRAAPENLRDLVSNLEAGSLDPRSIVLSYQTDDGGAAHGGVVAENLPPGALDVLTSTTSTSTPAQFRPEVHEVFKMPLYVVGDHSVSVKVRERR